MHLENTAMLWAFGAMALPLLIHFFFKRRYETFTFGAMTVLRMALHKRKDRILLEQVLVIATRVLLLACFAAALLHPVIGNKASATRPGTCLVLLFDNSYSMLSGEGLSRLARAKFVGRNLMDSVEPGDEIFVGSAVDPKRLVQARAFHDADDAKAAIQALGVAWKPKDLPAAVRAAVGLFAHSKRPRRELFIFTDPQQLGFGGAKDARWAAVAEELKKLDPAPRVFWVEPGKDEAWAGRSENLVVERPKRSASLVHAGEPLAFYVRVRNTSATEVKRADMVMEVDGAAVAQRQLALAAKGQARARFTHTFSKPGPHRVAFRVSANEDLLAEDDTVLHAVRAEAPLPVLLVDGRLTPEPLNNESDLARYALSPPPLGAARNRPYRVKVVSPVELRRMRQLRRHYAAILFINAREPDEALVNRLEQYVASGGGLLIALGDRCGKAYYNRVLYREGRGLLPCRIVSKGGDEAQAERFETPRIVPKEHPALAQLGLGEAGFENVRVRAWQRVNVPPTLSRTETLIRLAPSGDPWLLTRPFGRGTLCVLTTGLNAKWSDFPIHPSYVLLLRGLVDYLRAARAASLNLTVGEPLEGRFAFEARGAEHLLQAPDHEAVKLAVRRRFGLDVVRFERTGAPGWYTLQSDKQGREERSFYALNPDTAESDLTPAPLEARVNVAARLGARRVGGWPELESLFKRARRGVELWGLFLALVAAFALLEIALARLFTRSFVDESKLGAKPGAPVP